MKKLVEFENIIDYTSSYQVIYDKVASLVKEDSCINIETIELLLQANIIRNLGPKYSGLVLSIQSKWKKENTNLADAILQIVYYKDIFKKSNPKVLLTSQRITRGGYITPECIARNTTSHYLDEC